MTEHLINQIRTLEQEVIRLKDDRDRWQRLFAYEANKRVQMLRWKAQFSGIPQRIRLQFDNLLGEAKYTFHAEDYRKTQELLAEAQVMAMNEARLKEEAVS